MNKINFAKLNIAFGFVLFIFSAGLGPFMVSQIMDQTSSRNNALSEKLNALGKIQSYQENGFKDELDDKPELVKVGTVLANGIRTMNGEMDKLKEFAGIKTAHAHGNLESVLNIVVGLVLLFMAAPAIVRMLISLLFIFGALFHSGLMYLVYYPPLGKPDWALSLFQTGIGPVLILLGLVSMAVASILWLKGPDIE